MDERAIQTSPDQPARPVACSATRPESAVVLEIIEELGLEPEGTLPLQAHQALLVPARGRDGNPFLLKYFQPCPVGKFDPSNDPEGECQRREAAFYRFLDVVDRERCLLNSPRLVLTDPRDPPRWVLLEGLEGMRVAGGEELRLDWLADALRALQRISLKLTLGRRGLMLERWDPYAHREVVFRMQGLVEPKVGPKAWDLLVRTLHEAREWTDSQDPVLVAGRFQDEMLLLDDHGRIYLHEFRRVGFGNPDHDFGWYWARCRRAPEFKQRLLQLYCSNLGTSGSLRVEWAVRGVAIYLACVKLADAGPGEDLGETLELLERAILGGSHFFA